MEVTSEQLEWNSLKLKKVYKMMYSLRIRVDDALEARLAPIINHGGAPYAHPRFEVG